MTNALRRPRAAAIAVLAAVVLLGAGPLSNPEPIAAGTAARVEARLLELINAAREKRGRNPLETTAKLMDFAGDRAAKMAETKVLKHPKCLPCLLRRRDIPFTTYGETIAWSYAPWGRKAARVILRIWRNSPPHWGILMSPDYDRIGVGIARRPDGSVWAAAVLTG